ncbi:MAG: hypothetical protein WDW36_008690 [Sanguina aurantia]
MAPGSSSRGASQLPSATPTSTSEQQSGVEFEEGYRLSRVQFESLAQTPSIVECLADERLQALLTEIDASPTPEKAEAAAGLKPRAAVPLATKPTNVKVDAAPAPARSVPAPAAAALVVPRTRSQTAANAARETSSHSMSSLLQTRSELAAASKPIASPASPLPDIDSSDKLNPMMVTEYVNDIFSFYRRAEPKYRVPATYMSKQSAINEKMRGILVDWLVEVHLKFKLMSETLFLTVNLIDRFLDMKQVTTRNLQLVGVTAMLIGSKYEEIWAPEVRDFVYISDKAYTREQILSMEKLMLNTLKFNLTVPTQYNFMARYLKAAGVHMDKSVTMLASYLGELSLPDYSMLQHSYSMLSAASVYVAMRALNKDDPYPHTLARHSGYKLEQVRPVAAELVAMMQKAPTGTLTAVYKKYCSIKFMEIAKTAPPVEILEEAQL